MKLFWSPRSPFARKVMIAAHETGLADRLELAPANVLITELDPSVMAANPLNKIPVLVLDDGTRLYDSLVICLYLDSLHGGPRLVPPLPDGLPTLARHALMNGLLDVLILWRNERDRPEGTRSRAHLDAYRIKTLAGLAELEAHDPASPAGPLDLADITLGCLLGYLDFRFADLDWRSGHPRLLAFSEGFSMRPSAQQTVPQE